MVKEILFILLLSAATVTSESNQTNNGTNVSEKTTYYCIVDGEGPGIFIADPNDLKDSKHAGNASSSTYLDNTTETLYVNRNLSISTTWKIFNSVNETSPLRLPVFDHRWEQFVNNHDVTASDFYKENSFNYHISIKNYNGTALNHTAKLEQKWNLLKKDTVGLYLCNKADNCSMQIPGNIREFYEMYATQFWVIHNYTYLYSEKTNDKEIIIYSTGITENITENCEFIKKGCIFVFLAMCTSCSITLDIHSTQGSISNNFIGTGEWKTQKISLGSITNCFNISATTQITGNPSSPFWAVSDVAHFSKKLTCDDNKRYKQLKDVNMTGLTCENVLNENFNFTTTLTDSEDSPPTQSSLFNLLYLICIIPIVAILIIVSIYICRKKQSKNNVTTRARFSKINSDRITLLSNYEPDAPITPIRSSDFVQFVQEALDPKSKYNYLQLQFSKLPSGYLKEAEEGKKTENVVKNRYVKIYPYDENRIKLDRNLSDMEPSDYINASYVGDFNNPKEYIVSQNPLKNTVVDFWRMIWQEKVEYIIMISSINEEYLTYWPHLKKIDEYDGIEVFLEEVIKFEYYDHRILLVRRYGETRKLYQLHFHAWSQQLLSPHCFLEFINHLLKIPHNSTPVVFHCLAGVGRSATILLCDIALRSVALTGTFELFNITKRLRESRADMVTNVKQYQLAHLIIAESMNYKDLSIEINDDYEAHFSRIFESNFIKRQWSSYLENREWMYNAVTSSAVCDKYPNKNRYKDKNLLPDEHSRVILQYKTPNYIHAMHVNDYKQMNNLIVAQQPLHSTLKDFWIMILQQEVQIIINLNELDPINSGDCPFFPTSQSDVMRINADVTVKYSYEEHNLNYDKIGLTIFLKNEEQDLTLINIKNWPKIKSIPESTDVMISIWEATRGEKMTSLPILICCDDGIKASSLVACFLYMADKMIQQRKCDIVGVIKAIRCSCTRFISFDQFVFLHHCALAFYRDCFKQYSQ